MTVVGSGASGVHFALSALERGHEVVMLDVGFQKPDVVSPRLTFDEMKGDLNDSASYFLGPNFESLTLPGAKGEVIKAGSKKSGGVSCPWAPLPLRCCRHGRLRPPLRQTGRHA